MISPKRRTEETDKSGWRLPAKPLEQRLADNVLSHLRERLPIDLLKQASTDDLGRIVSLLDGHTSARPADNPEAILACIGRATFRPGRIEIVLDGNATANLLGVAPKALNQDALRFSALFQQRRRGVETKLVIGHRSDKAVDQTLMGNVAKAHQYYDAIKQGRTFEEIAAAANISKRRILQIIDLAFLAPDIVKSIIGGDQPIGLTSERLQRNPLPSNWETQRRIVATL